MNISLSISFNICFGCSKEQSHRDGSFEYPQHMLLLRNEKVNVYTLFSAGMLASIRSLTYLPSAVILIRDISAGVPTKAPMAPAVRPIPAFVAKFGGLPSLKQ